MKTKTNIKKYQYTNIIMKKKKKNYYHTQEELAASCVKNTDKIYLPDTDAVFYGIKTDTCIDIKTTNCSLAKKFNANKIDKNKKGKKQLYARKYKFIPTDKQKKILEHWYKSTIHLYNCAIDHFKEAKYYIGKKVLLRKKIKKKNGKDNKNKFKLVEKTMYRKPIFRKIRDVILAKEKKKIKNVPSHVLDATIKRAVAGHKSLLTNFIRKRIKKFRLRHKKYTKKFNKSVYVEPVYVSKVDGKVTGLGKLKLYECETGERYKLKRENIKHEFEIKYEQKNNRYWVYIVSDRKPEISKKTRNVISLDPGISPLFGAVTEKEAYIIGEEMRSKIVEKLKRIDKCNKSDKSNRTKRKYEMKIMDKINNMVDEMHWKLINYLTRNFEEIMVGDMSVSEILENNTVGNSICPMSKRVLQRMKIYVFKNRLKSRCEGQRIKYEEVNEYYTSKTCSVCGTMNKALRLGEKEYKCGNKKCRKRIHRDINGARCIYHSSRIERSV